MDKTLYRVEKELRPIRVALKLYDDLTGVETTGTAAITFLQTVDIYVQFFAETYGEPVLSKAMSSGTPADGLSIEENAGESYLVIDFVPADFADPNDYRVTAGKNKRKFEIQCKYVDGTDDEQYIFPHNDKDGRRSRLYVVLEKQLITE